MGIDPICGMTVDESSPLRADRDGLTYYFCSEHCRRTFVEQMRPEESVASEPATESGGHSHDGRSDVSSEAHAKHGHSHHAHGAISVKPSPAAKYFCPMCAGVESDKPGDCPKCGMALERNPAWVAPTAGSPRRLP